MTDLCNIPDTDLIALCYGDERELAFQTLHNRYNPKVHKFLCYRHFCMQSDVDDVLQLTWIKVSNNLHSFDSEKGTFRNWLFQVAKSCSIRLMEYKTRQKRGGLERVESLEEVREELKNCSIDNRTGRTDHPPDYIMEGKETLKEVLREIEKLPKVARDSIRYVCLEGLSYKETANIMDRTVGTITSKVSRMRARLTRKAFRVNFEGNEA